MQEGDPEAWWHESFKGHSDSKPKGPEAISFDLTFVGAKHVYGLPERATSMALKPTVGRPPPMHSSTTLENGLLNALSKLEFLQATASTSLARVSGWSAYFERCGKAPYKDVWGRR
jgi:hypothetical protein